MAKEIIAISANTGNLPTAQATHELNTRGVTRVLYYNGNDNVLLFDNYQIPEFDNPYYMYEIEYYNTSDSDTVLGSIVLEARKGLSYPIPSGANKARLVRSEKEIKTGMIANIVATSLSGAHSVTTGLGMMVEPVIETKITAVQAYVVTTSAAALLLARILKYSGGSWVPYAESEIIETPISSPSTGYATVTLNFLGGATLKKTERYLIVLGPSDYSSGTKSLVYASYHSAGAEYSNKYLTVLNASLTHSGNASQVMYYPNGSVVATHHNLNLGIIGGPGNRSPIISLTTPSSNQTLYENDTLSIAGTASDADAGNSVTVRYQINASTPRAIKAFIANGASEAFSKNLTFSGGSLYDDQTLIASGLVDGVPHTLKVWVTDDQGGTSTIVESTFYVVPNRTPLLTVDTPVIDGLIDNDEIEITGTYSDPDGNNATVAYRINGGNSVQVAAGTSGNYDFKIRFGQLKVGLNNIVIEVTDSYGAKASKTVKLQKDEVSVEQLKSTARYRIIPPLGTATGVVVWVQRDENLTLNASISMVPDGEAENFVAMTKTKTAPMPNSPGVVEDQFQCENATAAESIIFQLDLEKSALGSNERIHAITGVVD